MVREWLQQESERGFEERAASLLESGAAVRSKREGWRGLLKSTMKAFQTATIFPRPAAGSSKDASPAGSGGSPLSEQVVLSERALVEKLAHHAEPQGRQSHEGLIPSAKHAHHHELSSAEHHRRAEAGRLGGSGVGVHSHRVEDLLGEAGS